MTKLLIATTNPGKVAEFKRLLTDSGFELISLNDLCPIIEPTEDGPDFKANARFKAKHYGFASRTLTLADDSGFCLKDLKGFPGLHSARFAHECGGYPQAFDQLQQQIAKRNNPTYRGHFMCCLCLYNPFDEEIKFFNGKVGGTFTYPPRGDGGFGYCPAFTPDGANLTLAEMSDDMRKNHSHRARAITKLLKTLK